MRNVFLLSFLLLLSTLGFAKPLDPHARIAAVTDRVVVVIQEGKGYFDQDPQRFYAEVEKILDPLVDFPSFTRSVMGPYGTRGYYQSLKTPAEKEAYRKDYDRFVKSFKAALITTYAKGLLAFNGQKIEIVPPTPDDKHKVARGDYVDVIQTIQGDENKYQVVYKMRPDSKGQWLVRNVTIETINVGLLYRNQFVESMAKYKNDFGKVIDNWSVDAKAAEEKGKVLPAEAKP